MLRLYAAHPHCFGTLDGAPAQDAAPAVGGERYERVLEVDYDPARELLSATILVTRPIAPLAERACRHSRLHVRFFVDQGEWWEDAGIVSVDPLDLFASSIVPGQRTMRHVLTLPFAPRRGRLGTPELRVRAVLSSGHAPPAGDAAWSPPWGDARTRVVPLHRRYAAPTLERETPPTRARMELLLEVVGRRLRESGERTETTAASERQRGTSDRAHAARRPTRGGREGVIRLLERIAGGPPLPHER